MGSLAGTGVLAAVIALSCASLAGCAPQSNGAFHAVADPTPNAATIPQPPSPTSNRDVATSPSNAYAAQPQSRQTASADVAVAGSNSAAAQPQPGVASAVPTSDYRILPGDVLQITVFQVQDFNRDAQVDAAGNIALPLIGGVPAAGKTIHEVEGEIAGLLRAKYLQNPQVLVTIKDAVGQRVTIQGAVKSPGVIQIRGDTTLTAVIAQQGGFTDTADKSSVLIIRNTDQGRVAGKIDAGPILTGAAPDPRIYGGDTIVVDDSFVRSVGKDALNLLGGAAMLRVFFP